MRFRRASRGLLAVVWLAATAQAGEAAVFQVDQENLEAGGPGGISTVAGDLAQGFVPQDPFLGGIAIEVGCCLPPATQATVRLDVREGGIAGPVVGSSEIVLLDGTQIVSGDSVFQGQTWTFLPALNVTPGTLYVFEILVVSGGDITFTDTGDFYPQGSMYLNGSPSGGLDLVFQTGRFVPEPKLFWADTSFQTIERSDLGGANVETLATTAGFVNGLTVDPTNAVVYFVDCCGVSGGLVRADADGGNEVSIASSLTFAFPQRILVDPVNQYLFFSDSASTADDIQRIDTDGSNRQVLLGPDQTRAPIAMALDPIAGKLYWSDTTRDTITQSDLTGGNAVDIVLGLSFPRALDLVPTPVPEPAGLSGLVAGLGLLWALGVHRSRRNAPERAQSRAASPRRASTWKVPS